MAEAVLAGEEVEELPLERLRQVWLWWTHHSRGSRKTSSCVTVHAIAGDGDREHEEHEYLRAERQRVHLRQHDTGAGGSRLGNATGRGARSVRAASRTREPIGTETLHFRQRNRGIVEKPLDINALTPRRKRRQVARAARQHVHGPVVISAPEMVKGDANLQDALIEAAHVAWFSPPEQLQRFVLLEVLAAVELRDPLHQEWRRRLVAHGHERRSYPTPGAAAGSRLRTGHGSCQPPRTRPSS